MSKNVEFGISIYKIFYTKHIEHGFSLSQNCVLYAALRDFPLSRALLKKKIMWKLREHTVIFYARYVKYCLGEQRLKWNTMNHFVAHLSFVPLCVCFGNELTI